MPVDVRRIFGGVRRRVSRGVSTLRFIAGRARLVDRPIVFAARELRGKQRVALYHARGIDHRIVVRHSYPRYGTEAFDTLPLYEIVEENAYAPPPEVDRHLRKRADDARIVDLGGHIGYFGAFILSEYPRASLLSFEPEPSHIALLHRCIAVNGLSNRWRVCEAAAATEDGVVPFAVGRSVASFVADDLSDEVAIGVRSYDVFPYLQDVDLLKIDIEGAEWPILLDDRLGKVAPRAIVLEYHSLRCPSENAKGAAMDRLTELGYRVDIPRGDSNPRSGPFWGRGMLWAVRNDLG